MTEIVYVLTNPAMPGLVKIGKTANNDVQDRINELFTTGVPAPFRCEKAVKVSSGSGVEKALHKALKKNRYNSVREFFEIEADHLSDLLDELGDEDVTPQLDADTEDASAQTSGTSKKNSSKRRYFNFRDMRIPDGALLFAVGYDEVAEVIGNRKVKFRGEEMYLSAATVTLLDVEKRVVDFTDHWRYKGKIISSIWEKLTQK